MRRRNWIIGIVLLTLGLFQGFLTDQINPYHLQILNMIGINAVLAVSLNLVIGHTGQFSLGHAGFMALGAYAAAAFSVYAGGQLPEPLTFLVATLLGGLLAGVAALIVGIPTLRLRGDYLAIATLGLGEIIRVLILNLDFVGGARGFTGIRESSNFFWIYFFLLLAVLSISRLVSSSKGKALLAIREDEIAAESVGIHTTRYKVIAFTIGAFWAGVGGSLFAHLNTYLHTNTFGFLKSVEIVVMVVLGGMGSIVGSLISSALLTLLPELLRIASEWRMILYSLLLIVLMIMRPQGLIGRKK